MRIHDLPTPALVVDTTQLDANIDAMAKVRPGERLRPHVKAFKSTEMARYVAGRGGHQNFCCATLGEMEGMAAAGLGEDLLLANETLNSERLTRLVSGNARITVAVDSPETIAAAAPSGAEILVDVDVGLPRCGCEPSDAEGIATKSADAGLKVRGVMGYEGHVVGNPGREERLAGVDESMRLLMQARDGVGGLTSAGGTGTYDMHPNTDEVQAGSYLLMDTSYDELGLPFTKALSLVSTVISVSPKGWAIADCGLKSLGMDHGNPDIEGYSVFFCSDEHTTFMASEETGLPLPKVGDKVKVYPAHVDPTVAYHESFHLATGENVVDSWAVDLRGW